MNNVKVSVLIPVYNVERYIEKCVRTLFQQTMEEGIEFIFTDDCSPDNSLAILNKLLEEFPERREQVKIIHHPHNKGLAAARKTGFLNARGEYIIHCDSDDYVEPEMYELLYREAEKTDADIVGCDYFLEDDETTLHITQPFDLTPLGQLKSLVTVKGHRSGKKLDMMVWHRLFRRAFYSSFALELPDVNRDEDIALSIKAHSIARRIGYVAVPLYHYNISNPGSIMAGGAERFASDRLKVAEYIYDVLKNHKIYPEIEGELCKRLAVARILYRNRVLFNPEKWRRLYSNLPFEKYLPLKSRFFLFLVRRKHDFILKLLSSK